MSVGITECKKIQVGHWTDCIIYVDDLISVASQGRIEIMS
jgi:hypothetical protein